MPRITGAGHRLAGRLLAGALAVAALVLGGALPAEATPTDSVLVSADGTHFSSSLPAGLFPGTTVMIPGSTRSATLYVKNDSTVPSQLFVNATAVVVSSRDFARTLTLRATSAGAPSSPAVSLDLAAGCVALLAEPLAAGAVTRLTVSLAMSDVGGQVAQGGTLAASLGLALREADTAIAPVSSCDLSGIQLPVLGLPVDPSPWSLAFTGSTILYPALMTVGVLLGAGTWLVIAGRRRGRRAR